MASLYGLEGLGLGFHTEPSKVTMCGCHHRILATRGYLSNQDHRVFGPCMESTNVLIREP